MHSVPSDTYANFKITIFFEILQIICVFTNIGLKMSNELATISDPASAETLNCGKQGVVINLILVFSGCYAEHVVSIRPIAKCKGNDEFKGYGQEKAVKTAKLHE